MQVYLPLFVVIHRSSAGEFPDPCFHLRLEFGVDSQGKPFLSFTEYVSVQLLGFDLFDSLTHIFGLHDFCSSGQ